MGQSFGGDNYREQTYCISLNYCPYVYSFQTAEPCGVYLRAVFIQDAGSLYLIFSEAETLLLSFKEIWYIHNPLY